MSYPQLIARIAQKADDARQLAHQIRIRQAVKPVAPDPFVRIAARQGEGLRHRRLELYLHEEAANASALANVLMGVTRTSRAFEP